MCGEAYSRYANRVGLVDAYLTRRGSIVSTPTDNNNNQPFYPAPPSNNGYQGGNPLPQAAPPVYQSQPTGPVEYPHATAALVCSIVGILIGLLAIATWIWTGIIKGKINKGANWLWGGKLKTAYYISMVVTILDIVFGLIRAFNS